jgi:periplasmic divalent cation tolerance protein
MKSSIIYSTAGSMQEAKRIANILLKNKLAACINIFPIQSFYNWNGRLCNEKETALIIKTTQNRVNAVIKKIKSIHSYEVPCIISFDIDRGNKEFLDWIAGEVK